MCPPEGIGGVRRWARAEELLRGSRRATAAAAGPSAESATSSLGAGETHSQGVPAPSEAGLLQWLAARGLDVGGGGGAAGGTGGRGGLVLEALEQYDVEVSNQALRRLFGPA
jgi:hypothetical protein